MSDTSASEKLRVFIALPLPDPVKAEIAKAQASLRAALPESRITWTRREQFHLTLRFLGNVEGERMGSLVDAVRHACQGCGPFSLRAERIGFFPNARRPRVIWTQVHDTGEQLARLEQAIQAATRDFTTEKAENRFSAHVTLGRIKTMARQETTTLGNLASNIGQTIFGEWLADRIEIMRSELSSERARHSSVAVIRLVAPIAGQIGRSLES